MNENIQKAVTLAKRNIVDMIYKNANVEGLGTTYLSTYAILNNAPVETRRDEVLFILNMRDAYHFLLENIDYTNCFMLIREFNKICGRDLFYNAGKLRSIDISIGGTTWKPELPISDIVLNDILEIDKCEDPVTKAVAYFCYFCRKQLFIDGNKRVAQLMANKVLIENGIGILSIPVERLSLFKELLIEYYETDNAKKLCMFLVKYCIERI